MVFSAFSKKNKDMSLIIDLVKNIQARINNQYLYVINK